MELTRGTSGDQRSFVDGLVVTALRVKWFLGPMLFGVLCGLVGWIVGGLLGAILVAYMLIIVVVSGIGLLGLMAIKAYERRD